MSIEILVKLVRGIRETRSYGQRVIVVIGAPGFVVAGTVVQPRFGFSRFIDDNCTPWSKPNGDFTIQDPQPQGKNI